MSSDTVFLLLKLNLNFPSLFLGNVDCLLKGLCFIIHGYVLSIIHIDMSERFQFSASVAYLRESIPLLLLLTW